MSKGKKRKKEEKKNPEQATAVWMIVSSENMVKK